MNLSTQLLINCCLALAGLCGIAAHDLIDGGFRPGLGLGAAVDRCPQRGGSAFADRLAAYTLSCVNKRIETRETTSSFPSRK